jgi:hypothetical protein
MMEGANSSMIYCKNFCKCHNVPPPSTTITKYLKIRRSKIKVRQYLEWLSAWFISFGVALYEHPYILFRYFKMYIEVWLPIIG